MKDDRVEINGVKVHPFTSKTDILDFVNTNQGALIAINADKIHRATDDTRRIINKHIGYVDGLGAQYVLKKLGYKDAIKIPGCELWLDLIKANYKKGCSFYLVGGTQEVVDAVVEKLRVEFPGINIANYRNGFLKEENERVLLIDNIVTLKPDYVFVAMGSPKQEILIEEMYEKHKAVYQGLGGSFDVYTQNVKRAPQWFINHNMEGVYRVFNDFNLKRLKRFCNDLAFMAKAFFGKYNH